MTFQWGSKKEAVLRGLGISCQKKLEAIRLMNELTDKVLSKRQKAIRRELRKSVTT